MDCNYYSTYQSDVLNIFHLFYMKFFDFLLVFIPSATLGDFSR